MSQKATSIINPAALPDRTVYIVGPYQKPFRDLFLSRTGYRGTLNIAEADIVLFTGGPDIDPSLYGEQRHKLTNTSDKRDEEDLKAWAESGHALRVGICRGAQFLNVMCGGKLWQDVDGHRTSHHIFDLQTGQKIFATSTHHQMMIPSPDAYKVAICHVANKKENDAFTWRRPEDTKVDPHREDHEVLWYEEQNCLCFQPHPENLSASVELRTYFFQKLWTAYQIYLRNLQKAC